jgi:hypothetical protein
VKRRGRLRPVSKKRAGEQVRRDQVVAAALARDGGCIARCVVTEIECSGRLDADEWQLRSDGGDPLDVWNVQTLCRAHHRWKHTHPIEAAHYGLRPFPRGYIAEASSWRLGAVLRADRPPDGE